MNFKIIFTPKYLMKLLSILLLSLLNINYLNAQEKLSDVNRIVLNTYVPEQAEPMPAQAKTMLENKLSQIATSNGMGGSAINPRFVIVSNVSVLSKDIIAGPPQMLAYNLEVTFYIADAIDLKKFSNASMQIKGVGINETKAYIEAIKGINVKSDVFTNFIIEGKSKIIALYNSQCDFIIRDAISLSNKGEYDAAILKLAAVPDVCESCYIKCIDTMQYVFQLKIDKECLLKMREAKALWMANPNANGAAQVAEIINSISPFSTCNPDADNLMLEIQKKLATEEKAKWEFQIQKHKDAVKLKEDALRIDEENSKRQAMLQKDLQKQQYALNKADQEADGFRGFVNSIAKLKMTIWRETSNDYINSNTNKIDYSKLR